MIKIKCISIKEFRGIRNLFLDIAQENYAICGPNGTGKSGIVDALEFVLTGSISRLTGEGRGELSIKQHGPHVVNRDKPGKSIVAAEIWVDCLQKTATIERSLDNPNAPIITPGDPDILEILQYVKSHPEIVLTRRELIKYILATPGDRSKEVQSLLRFDSIEQCRAALRKIANNKKKELKSACEAVLDTEKKLMAMFGLQFFDEVQILTRFNNERAILDLPAIPRLQSVISVKDGIPNPAPTQVQRVSKAYALDEIKEIKHCLADLTAESLAASISRTVTEIDELRSDPLLAAASAKEGFYNAGIELVESESCPLCDKEWNQTDLIARIKAKIEHLQVISKKRKGLEAQIEPWIKLLARTQASIARLVQFADLVAPSPATEACNYIKQCASMQQNLINFLPLINTQLSLSQLSNVPPSFVGEIDALENIFAALPDASKQEHAREFLTLAKERLEVYYEAKEKCLVSETQSKLAKHISEAYENTSDKVLSQIYNAVEQDFSRLYRYVNRDDENEFVARLRPAAGKLEFDVDFYGNGFFPPAAYHSEGHQDGMGLCLYLALMRHLQKDRFTFAVLDDVLMSVDAGHRREICGLLKREFPDTQFIITTHDPIWLKHLTTEKLLKNYNSSIHFKSWSVEHGPTSWEGRDVWDEINKQLAYDVPSSAALLRNFLEYTAAELCHRLRAPVPYRADARYQLGELLPAATREMKKLYRKTSEAANSWNKRELVEQLKHLSSRFADVVESSKVDQWQINEAIHFNTWQNLTKNEFERVIDAFKNLLTSFKCKNCDEYIYVSPERGSAESVRCSCDDINLNLKKKE